MGRFEKFQISSRGFNDSIDITRLVVSAVKKQGAVSGVVQIFAPDFTSCVVAVPKGVPIVQDLHEIIGEFIPVDKIYQFDEKYNTNAYAHLRSVFLGNSPGHTRPHSPFRNSSPQSDTYLLPVCRLRVP